MNHIFHYLRFLLCFALCMSTASVFSQKSTKIYTDKDIEQVIAENPELCNCPEPKSQVVVAESPRSEKLSFMISGGLNYFYGTGTSEISNVDQELGSWYGEVMLGYSYFNSKGKAATTLGVFGKVGNTTASALEKLWVESQLDGELNAEERNTYYSIEAGAILFQFLRLSTGMGRQEYRDPANELQDLVYYSTTAGIQLGTQTVRLLLDVNMAYGRELPETMIRPHLGVGLQF